MINLVIIYYFFNYLGDNSKQTNLSSHKLIGEMLTDFGAAELGTTRVKYCYMNTNYHHVT